MIEKQISILRRVIDRGGKGSGHHGHKGRPGKIGGSAPGGGGTGKYGQYSSSEPRTDKEKKMRVFIQQMVDLRSAHLSDKLKDFQYTSIDDMLLKIGRWYEPPTDSTLPPGCESGEARECFSNAFRVALESGNDELLYTEGYAITDALPFPTPHAWLTTPEGKVVDPTWRDRGIGYLGIPMTTEFVVREISKSGYYGVLADMFRAKDIYRDGFPDDAIIARGGPGSGFFGHAGRDEADEVGGSLPRDGAGDQEQDEERDRIDDDVLSSTKSKADDASEIEPEITELLNGLAENNNGEMENLEYRLKTEESLAFKIARDMEEKGISAEEAADSINDAVRYTMVLDRDNYVKNVANVQSELAKRGWVKYDTKWKNFFLDTDGPYRGYNTVLVNEEGERFELQFHTGNSYTLKNKVWKMYSEFRKLPENSPRRLKLFNKMRDAWDGYQNPPNIASLEGIVPGE